MRCAEASVYLNQPETPAERGIAVGAAKLIVKWAEATIDDAREAMERGEAVTGFKLQEASPQTKITDAPQAFAALEQCGMKADALTAMSLSNAKLTKTAKNIVKPYTETTTARPSVVVDKSKGD